MQYLAIALLVLLGLFILKRIFSWLTSQNKREEAHGAAEDIALVSRVATVIAGISVYFLAPAGIMAFFAAPPLIVSIAPLIAAFAAGAYAIHALAKLYDKKRKK
jgi:fatty acid desaturase